MINSASDTSIPRILLVNHTLHLSINVHHVCSNNTVALDCYQRILHTILYHICNIHFRCHVISNYFVDNSSLFINFDWIVMTDTSLLRFYFINHTPNQLLNSCSIIDMISLFSVGHISPSSRRWKSRSSWWFMDSNSGIYYWTINYILVSKRHSTNIIILSL